MARCLVEERVKKARTRFELGLYSVLADRLGGDTRAEVYVASFTENADQLSQWRAYCPPTGGYAVGFRSKDLVQLEEGATPDRFLVRCVYDRESQETLIRNLIEAIDLFAEENARKLPSKDRLFRESFKLLGRLLPLVAPALKDPTFAEEQEWRLVRLPISFEEGPPDFREGRSMLIPYHGHSFPAKAGGVPIEELVIGPTPHAELARDAAEALLSSHGLAKTTLRSSSIPYRTW
jgi:hypothetical protein